MRCVLCVTGDMGLYATMVAMDSALLSMCVRALRMTARVVV